jgi:hypothetical protein
MAQVCIIMANDISVQALLTPIEAAMATFALEFGQKCSILSAVDNFLGDDFRKNTEQAIKDVSNAASTLYKGVKSAIAAVNAITAEGLAILLGVINSAWGMINSAIAAVNTAIDQVADAMISSVNAATSALCNELNSALTGLPSDVTLKSPGLLAAQIVKDKIAALNPNASPVFTPKALIAGMLDNLGVKNLRNSMTAAAQALASVPKVPDLKSYVCTP